MKKIARRQSQDSNGGKGNKNKNGDGKKEKSDEYKSDDTDQGSILIISFWVSSTIREVSGYNTESTTVDHSG